MFKSLDFSAKSISQKDQDNLTNTLKMYADDKNDIC